MIRRGSRNRSSRREVNSVRQGRRAYGGRGRSQGFDRFHRGLKSSRDTRSRRGQRASKLGAGQRTSSSSKERISLESGYLLLIDQFMPACDLFLKDFETVRDGTFDQKVEVIRKYGGEVVSLEPGEFKIARDPYKFYMAIYPEKGDFSESELDKSMKPVGEVLVNTRCLALMDWELLNDTDFLNQYSSLWNSGKDKKCRDLVREAGGAVRYGFNRHGDELGVHLFKEASRVYLWPINEPSDVIENEFDNQSQSEALNS